MVKKSMNLHVRAVLVVTAFMIATSAFLGTMLTRQSRMAMKTLIDERILDVANTAADMLDGDALGVITYDDRNTTEYKQLYNTLSSFEKNIRLEYIYAVRETDDGSFMFVIDPATENASDYGEKVYMTEALQTAGKGTPAVDAEPLGTTTDTSIAPTVPSSTLPATSPAWLPQTSMRCGTRSRSTGTPRRWWALASCSRSPPS